MVHLQESLDRQKNNGDHAVRKLRLNKPHLWVQISRQQEEALQHVDPLPVDQEHQEEQEVHQLLEEHQQQEVEEHQHLEEEDLHRQYLP
jgi:hypothetical protein